MRPQLLNEFSLNVNGKVAITDTHTKTQKKKWKKKQLQLQQRLQQLHQ